MNKFRFAVSLRIFHPAWPAKDVIAHIGREPKVAHSVGERRQTPKGTGLKGVYDRTYVSFALDVRQDAELEEFLLSQLSGPMLADPAFAEACTASGGMVEFFVGVFLTGNSGIILTPELSEALWRKKVTLNLDIYPDDD